LDKKSDPRYIRFRHRTEIKIEEISLAEQKEFTEIVEMLVNLGLHEYEFIKKNFSIRPTYSAPDE